MTAFDNVFSLNFGQEIMISNIRVQGRLQGYDLGIELLDLELKIRVSWIDQGCEKVINHLYDQFKHTRIFSSQFDFFLSQKFLGFHWH